MAGGDTTTIDKGRRLEDEVAQIYRSLGYEVDQNLRLGGQQIDILISQNRLGVPPTRLMVECKNWATRSVTNQDVYEFWNALKFLIDDGHIGGGVMVCAKGYSDNAKGAAHGRACMTLLTVQELRRKLLEVVDAQQAAIHDYEASDVHAHYLSLDASLARWTTEGIQGDHSVVVDAELDVLQRIDALQSFSLLILADYGSGKTTLLERLRYRMLQRRQANKDVLLPVVVELKGYHVIPDVFELIRSSIRRTYLVDIPPATLRDQLDQGRLFLMFDGFDEMVEKSDARRRAVLLAELLPYFDSTCPSIITSRPSYFVDPNELLEFGRQVERWSAPVSVGGQAGRKRKVKARARALDDLKSAVESRNSRLLAGTAQIVSVNSLEFPILYLQPLDHAKIKRYVYAHARELDVKLGLTPDQVLQFIARTYDLHDLAERPMLLKLIMDTVFGGCLELNNSALSYGPSSLYEIYTAMKLQIDSSKGATRAAVRGEARRALSQMIALAMHRRGVLEVAIGRVKVELHDLSKELAEKFPELGQLSLEEMVTDFLTCSFLRIHANGECSFVHKSFREFFVARSVKDLPDVRRELLATELPREILYFLGGFAPTEPSLRNLLWNEFTKTTREDVVQRRNLLLAVLFSEPAHGPRTVRDVQMWDAKLRECVLNQWRLDTVELLRIAIEALRLNNVRSVGLLLTDCAVDRLGLRHGTNEMRLERSSIAEVSAAETSATITMDGCEIVKLSTEKSTAVLAIFGSTVGSVVSTDSEVTLEIGDGARLDTVEVTGGLIKLDVHARGLVNAMTFESTFLETSLGSLGRARVVDCLIDARSGTTDAPVAASFKNTVALVGNSFDGTRLGAASGLILVGGCLDGATGHARLSPGVYLLEDAQADDVLGDQVDAAVSKSRAVLCRRRWWVTGRSREGHPAFDLQRRLRHAVETRRVSGSDVTDVVGGYESLVSSLDEIAPKERSRAGLKRRNDS